MLNTDTRKAVALEIAKELDASIQSIKITDDEKISENSSPSDLDSLDF